MILFSPEILSVVGFTLKQVVLSVLGAWAIGFMGMAIFNRIKFFELMFVLPPVVLAPFFLFLGKSLNIFPSLGFVVVAHTLVNAPWVARELKFMLEQIPSIEKNIIQTLGGGKISIFRWVILPRLQSVAIGISLQVALFCLMSFVWVLWLGGGPPVETLETFIFSSIQSDLIKKEIVYVAIFWQMVLGLLLSLPLYLKVNSFRYFEGHILGSSDANIIKKGLKWGVMFFLSTLIFWKAQKHGIKKELFEATLRSMGIALGVALGTVSLAFLFTKIKNGIYFLMSLISSVSAVTLGVLFLKLFSYDPWEGSTGLIFCFQMLLFLPFSYRYLLSALPAKDPSKDSWSWIGVARSLGASPLRAWWIAQGAHLRWVVCPLAGWIAAWSLGEVVSVLFFSGASLHSVSSGKETLALLISVWMERYRFEQAFLASGLIILISWFFLEISQKRYDQSRL